MNTSVAAISERDFAAQLVDDGPGTAAQSNDASGVERGPATAGEQLLRRLFHPSYANDKQQPSPRFDAQDL